MDYMRQHYPQGEVIVVDDGSSDKAATLARQTLAGAVRFALPSSVTNRISEKDERSGSVCSRREARSRSFPMPIYRRRLQRRQNWSIRF